MSIASEITRINNNIASAYTAVSNKGGTLPATQNSANLASAINTISGGGTTYPFTVDYLIVKKTSATDNDVTAIANFVNSMTYSKLYIDDDGFKNSTFTNASSMAGTNATYSNTKLGIKRLASISSGSGVGGNIFEGCTSMTTPPFINFSECYAYNKMFYNCSSITTFPSDYFYTVPRRYYYNRGQYQGEFPDCTCTSMFEGCTNLTTISFPTTSSSSAPYAFAPLTSNNMFKNCTSLTSVSNIDFCNSYSINGMFYGCSNLSEITFGSYNMSKVGNLGSAFCGCYNVSNTTLDNILRSVATITKDSNRKFSRLFEYSAGGFVAPASFVARVRASQYYQTCISAGWVDNFING